MKIEGKTVGYSNVSWSETARHKGVGGFFGQTKTVTHTKSVPYDQYP